MSPDKREVVDIIDKSLYFIGIESTRKTATEEKYLLVTTKSNLYYAQREADNMLAKYYRRNRTYTNQTETLGRRKKPLIYNHSSTYVEELFKYNPTTNNQPTQYSPSSYHHSVIISFTNNNDTQNDFQPSPF